METAILFSGRGSNMESILERSLKSDSKFSVKLTITNNPIAPGIQIARSFNKPCLLLSKENWYWQIFHALNYYSVDFVILAGFMKILPSCLCFRWNTKIVNIHPSLLPNYKGLHTHSRVLTSGDKEHGCSIHYVTPELDAGVIIAQAKVPVLSGDTEDSLAARVLEQENLLYPEVIQNISLGYIRNKGNQVLFRNKILSNPLTHAELLHL